LARKSVKKTTKKARTKPAKKAVKKAAPKPGRKAVVKKVSASATLDPLVVAKEALAGLIAELDRLDPTGANPVIVDMKMKAVALDQALTCQVGLTQPLAG
jgi:hypothetical protein